MFIQSSPSCKEKGMRLVHKSIKHWQDVWYKYSGHILFLQVYELILVNLLMRCSSKH